MLTLKSTIIASCLIFAWAVLSPSANLTQIFDRFGDVPCDDEEAHLDNFAIELMHSPDGQGYIIFYGGRRYHNHLPRKGEAEARAARLKPYLLSRGIREDQVIVINGGYRETWEAELWIVPRSATPPPPTPTLQPKEIKFRKGKVRKRDYECEI